MELGLRDMAIGMDSRYARDTYTVIATTHVPLSPLPILLRTLNDLHMKRARLLL